ncbi:FG-GAP repeat domain-containing protein [Sandarakinorhabdus rubra]|uniref:FG-GAP repeat domain-containing protein n=1 Tax=Sandarakinorhabdus rubra TaxID=2672568 RepID=UPI0013DA0849|nr:VCBS repeat-containing protein [Sandarakinorhabdus rubra]
MAFTSLQEAEFAVPGSLSNAWGDYDGDGDSDLAVSIKGIGVRLYRNEGGRLVNAGAALGLPASDGGEYRGLSWADVDGDGRLDLYAGSAAADKPSRLFMGTGTGFVDRTADWGLALPGRSSRQNSLVDWDNDGRPDLFATDRFGRNRLFRNSGSRFEQVAAQDPISSAQSTVGACWLDFDRDGDLDLFLANQIGKQDQLWRNDGGGQFVNVAPALGIHSPGRKPTEGGVGCAVADVNNDGLLDIFVPNYGRNALWLAAPGGRFVAAAASWGVDEDNHAVGAAVGDYDHDGNVDISLMSYRGDPPNQVPDNRLFQGLGNRFANVLPASGPLDRGDHGTAFVDIDGDGDLDLSITKGYNTTGGHFLFRNDLPAARARQSVKILVLDASGHVTQAGAEVRVLRRGRLIGMGQVPAGGGYGTQHALPVHVATPGVARVDVEVTFMSANGRKLQRVTGVDVRKLAGGVLTVRRAV